MTRAVVIPVDGEPYATELSTPPTLDEIKPLIGGGWLEAVPLRNGDHAYIDEEGKLKGLPPNELVTLLSAIPDLIVGDAVVFGPPDGKGDETDPVETLALFGPKNP